MQYSEVVSSMHTLGGGNSSSQLPHSGLWSGVIISPRRTHYLHKVALVFLPSNNTGTTLVDGYGVQSLTEDSSHSNSISFIIKGELLDHGEIIFHQYASDGVLSCQWEGHLQQLQPVPSSSSSRSLSHVSAIISASSHVGDISLRLIGDPESAYISLLNDRVWTGYVLSSRLLSGLPIQVPHVAFKFRISPDRSALELMQIRKPSDIVSISEASIDLKSLQATLTVHHRQSSMQQAAVVPDANNSFSIHAIFNPLTFAVESTSRSQLRLRNSKDTQTIGKATRVISALWRDMIEQLHAEQEQNSRTQQLLQLQQIALSDPMTSDSRQQQQQHSSQQRGLDLARLFEGGRWIGVSAPSSFDPALINASKSKYITLWCDVVFHVVTDSSRNRNRTREDAVVAGSGFSQWRGERIPFDIWGRDISWEPTGDTNDIGLLGQLTITKQHTGLFTNSVEYQCQLMALPQSEVDTLLSLDGGLDVDDDLALLGTRTTNGSASCICLVGQGPSGIVRLAKVPAESLVPEVSPQPDESQQQQQQSSPAAMDFPDDHTSELPVPDASEAVYIKSISDLETIADVLATGDGEGSLASCESEGTITPPPTGAAVADHIITTSESSLAAATTPPVEGHDPGTTLIAASLPPSPRGRRTVLSHYRLLISDLLLGRGTKPNSHLPAHPARSVNTELLRFIHTQCGISPEEHNQVLSSLGWSHASFVAAIEDAAAVKPPPTADQSTTSLHSDGDRDLCKICFANEIDCVLLPCEHFAVCTQCGMKLDFCPFDRVLIAKIQHFTRM